MLPAQPYFTNAVGTVDFVGGAFVHLRWSGQPLRSPELRALYVHARNLLLRHALPGLLADHRAMPAAPTPADRQWLLGQWLPQTVAQTRYVRCAVLPAPDPTHRLHTAPLVRDLRRYLAVTLFEDYAPAVAWLSSAG